MKKSKRKVRLDLMMTEKTKNEMKQYCKKHQISMSEYIEYLVEEDLKLDHLSDWLLDRVKLGREYDITIKC